MSSLKLSLLTNQVAPYRVPFFKALAESDEVSRLRVLVCVDREVDRQWEIKNDPSYKVVKLFGLTLNLNKAKHAKRIIHIRLGIFWELLRYRPDYLIVGDASWTSFLALFACKVFNIPLVVWNEITINSKVSEGVIASMRRSLFNYAKVCIASCSQSEQFLLNNGCKQEKIAIAWNAIDNSFYLKKREQYEPERAQIRKNLGIVENAFVFIFVGQLIERKQPFEVLKNIISISESQSVHLIFAGTGSLEPALKKEAENCAFTNINFCGFVAPDKLSQLYVASDGLVLLSDDEPWGMVVNEAMLFGKPVLVSKEVGAIDIVNDSVGVISNNKKELCESFQKFTQKKYHSQAIVDHISNVSVGKMKEVFIKVCERK